VQDLYLDITASEEYKAMSGISNSNVKFKYSTSTLGVAVWQKRNSCIVCL